MLTIHRVEISKEEYERFSRLSERELDNEIMKIAVKHRWKSNGYGIYGTGIEADKTTDKYYVMWGE